MENDGITAYYPEEMVILAEWQNRGCGKQLLREIERRVPARGAKHMEMISVKGEHHMHFCEGFGLYEVTNLRLMGKHCDCPHAPDKTHPGHGSVRGALLFM